MAGKGDTFENDLLKLIFYGTTISNIADNAASSPNTALYLALHTATVGEAGNQGTNECAYGAYARASVARSTAGFKVTGSTAYLRAAKSFAQATSGTETANYFSVGTAATGTGKVLYSGAITPTISVSAGVTPSLTTGTNITED